LDLKPLSPRDEAHLNSLKQKAVDAMSNNDFQGALQFLDEAISHGHDLCHLYVSRAEVLLGLRRPLAAVRDATESLSFNPNYCKALQVRGIAYRHLQDWCHAQRDLSQAQAIDFSESIDPVARFVQEKYNIFFSLQRKYELEIENRQNLISDFKTKLEIEALERIQKEAEEEISEEARAEGEGMRARLGPNICPADLFEKYPKLEPAMKKIDKNPQAYEELKNDPEIGQVLTCLWEHELKSTARVSGM
jgi:tetratricopeptide (TPR) repeat protein